MTRTQLNKVVDRLAVAIADRNGFDITGNGISPGVHSTHTMVAHALEKLHDQLVDAGTIGGTAALAPKGAPKAIETATDAA